MDRKIGEGIETFLDEDHGNVPDFLKSYSENRVREFSKISVMGDYESANIGICVQGLKEDRINILLRSDINTKGCIHWFMFTVVAKEPCYVTFCLMNNTRNGQLFKEGM